MPHAIKPDSTDLYELHTSRSERFGYLLLAGLAVELLFAIFVEKPLIEWASTLISDAMIVIGVWGEIHFGRKARVAGDTAQAAANDRAKQAVKETEQLRSENLKLQSALRPRRLLFGFEIGSTRAERLASLLKFSGIEARILCVPDFEAQKLANDIFLLLQRFAKWSPIWASGGAIGMIDDGVRVYTIEDPFITPSGTIVDPLPQLSDVGHAASELVRLLELDLGPPRGPQFFGVHWHRLDASDPLGPLGDFPVPKGVVMITVGCKPFRMMFPPHESSDETDRKAASFAMPAPPK